MQVHNEMLIDGAWVGASTGATFAAINPANEAVIGQLAEASLDDVARACDAAAAAWTPWREVDAWSRSGLLRRAAVILREREPMLSRLLCEEQGKPLAEAAWEVRTAAEHLDWYADEARRIHGQTHEGHSQSQRHFVVRQPIGPVAAITSGSLPALMPVRKVAPALACGCTVVLLPAPEGSRTALAIAEALADAGFPAGVVNVITGKNPELRSALVAAPEIRKVAFSGHAQSGRELARIAADHVKPASLDLGGHAPVLVFEDADVELAAEASARGKFRNAGQLGTAPSRVFVHEAVARRFREAFAQVARMLRVGDGADPKVDMGPLMNRELVARTEAIVDDAVGKGACVASGGRRPPAFSKGFFYEPTVLTEVTPSMRVLSEESFGPIASLMTFSQLQEVTARANACNYGLAAYVFTRSTRTAFLASEGLDVGVVAVNHTLIASPEIAVGGVKLSGMGRDGGTEGLAEYMVSKHVSLRL